MQDLVTAGNNQIEQMKGMPLAANSTIGNARVQQSVSDLAAQVGSMQTLMSAASGQMAAAKTQLDTTVSTVSSIYSDQVNYYTALQSFYSNQEKSNDSKIATLTADQKTYLDQQLTEAQSNLAQVQKNAQSLADAMTNPDTALAYNQAGVTVNDTPEQINQKLATYAYSKELSTQSQNMADKGYQAVIPGQKVPANAVDTLTVTDSKGIAHQYYTTQKPTATTNADQKQADMGDMASALASKVASKNSDGSQYSQDGKLTPQDWTTARNNWMAEGYLGSDFDTQFAQYNPGT